jgi:hypothetical protein
MQPRTKKSLPSMMQSSAPKRHRVSRSRVGGCNHGGSRGELAKFVSLDFDAIDDVGARGEQAVDSNAQ